MDEMGTPGPNHPARRGLDKRTANQFSNVYDFTSTRALKETTGRSRAVRAEAPDFAKHADEAMAMGNKPVKKKSLLDKASDLIGLGDTW